MTQSYTTTETWSRTHARKVGGKVVADLRQMQQAYGSPTDHWLDQYLEELVVLLADGVLKEVTYGFKRNGSWVVALRYSADMAGNLSVDDRSGSIPRGVDISGATWGSYLIKNSKWNELSQTKRAELERDLPFQRQGAEEPTVTTVIRSGDRTYSSAGNGVRRSTIGGA